MVGLTGFEPAASSSRTRRATKLRHSPIAGPAQPGDKHGRAYRLAGAAPNPGQAGAGVSVSRVASGRQATRNGVSAGLGVGAVLIALRHVEVIGIAACVQHQGPDLAVAQDGRFLPVHLARQALVVALAVAAGV